MEKKIHVITEMKDKLLSQLPLSLDEASVEVNGQIVDMVKDLAQAEKDCWKACYYKSIVEAMKKEKDDGERYGYDKWRYASGEFAPKGRGHRSGYPMYPEIYDPMNHMADAREFIDPMRIYGYNKGNSRNESSSKRYGFPMDGDMMDVYKRPYDKFMDSKRHYHESNDPNAKKEMDDHAREHLGEVLMTTKEIFGDASPDMKKRMKQELMAMVNAWQV